MTALVVLPGLDGTGTMLSDFTASARRHFAFVDVIDYPRDAVLDYAQLETLVRRRLPEREPFVLLGESFSGPVALSIAADPPPNLAGLALSTSFADAPSPLLTPLARLTSFAPVRAAPTTLLSWWLLGRWATRELQDSLAQALASVSPDVLSSRAAMALRADAASCLGSIRVPVLLLRATDDRLLASRASDRLLLALPHASLLDVTGPHLLLQIAPDACADAIREFCVGSSAHAG